MNPHFTTTRLALLFSVLPLAHAFIIPRQTAETMFDWTKVEPKPTLDWESCYGTRECARFSVPLDWKIPDGEKAAIAVMRFKSPLGSEHPDYLGPVWINPGGPGVSGVQMVQDSGEFLSATVGPQFDVVSFDPRGVGSTTPRIALYPTCADRVSSQGPLVDLDSAEGALPRLWAEIKLRGRFAEAQNDVSLKHVTTSVVARDMLAMSKASGYEKIRYWGLSYGTVLGATYGAMFPDNIERIVLDGVVDADNYYDTLWNKTLDDADKALQWFFDSCHEAGPTGCAFYEETPALIKMSYDNVLESLRSNPVPVFVPATNSTAATAAVVDYSSIKSSVLGLLYNPPLWPLLAQALAALKQGDATSALAGVAAKEVCGCDADPLYDNIAESANTIRCTDGAPVEDTVDELREFHAAINSTFSGLFYNRLSCVGWKIRPAERFTGPFTANTPFLFIGNTADPVTPIANAHKMAQGFAGSVVLTQNSPGHASTAVASNCTMGYISGYFVNGTLPAAGTVCEMNAPIFAVEQGARSLNVLPRSLF